jgi:predicted lactoylglutathione lyase
MSDQTPPPVWLTLQPMVHVRDLAASVAFYEQLGGQLRRGSRDDDWACRDQRGLDQPLGPSPNPEQNAVIVELNFESGSDLGQVEADLTTGGVTIAQPVTATDFGRQLQIKSPDGLLIKINQFGPAHK